MMAGMLRNAGYFMGDDYIPARAANPKGFFEDREVNRLNDALIAAHLNRSLLRKLRRAAGYQLPRGIPWLAKLPGPIRCKVSEALAMRMRERLSNVPFCYKDPRFSYTLPAWEPYLPSDIRFVVVFRDPARTTDSIVRVAKEQGFLARLRINTQEACAIWYAVYRSILRLVAGSDKFIFVHYDQLLNGSRVGAIEEFLGASMDRSFAEASIRRSQTEGSESLPRAVERVYCELCRLAHLEPQECLCG
jgi:hypothetical protein